MIPASRTLVAASLLLVSGCATGSVLLLPNEDGQDTGAVAVIDEKGREVVVDRPLNEANLGAGSRPRAVKEVKKSYSELLAGLPRGSVGFVLTFLPSSTTMTPESRPVLDQIRKEIADRPGAEVQVTGHTDTVGKTEDNDRLSEKRAQAIVAVLIAEGFPADLLTSVGRGERDPLIPTGDEVANDGNRRVEVIVR